MVKTISRWLKKCIAMTYQSSKDKDSKMSDVKALQVTCKAFAASMVFSNELTIQKSWMHFLACLLLFKRYNVSYNILSN